ncbi:MAG: prepilin-type N-terminal cleavage/methylation domain-containing protein [Desulfuromonadales bacterium]|nr:prepilin-type N-terminal cleavage/methylation domain-containing protein [Desulfuromonadales bacterium]
MQSEGFTLVELVVVILLLGIMAAFALPKFFDLGDYRTRAAYDEVAGALRYGQKLAVASGCDVRVQIYNNGYAIQQRVTSCTSGSFVNIADHPITNSTFSGVTITPVTSFIFDKVGRSSNAATINVGNKSFSVVAETGTVDAQ